MSEPIQIRRDDLWNVLHALRDSDHPRRKTAIVWVQDAFSTAPADPFIVNPTPELAELIRNVMREAL